MLMIEGAADHFVARIGGMDALSPARVRGHTTRTYPGRPRPNMRFSAPAASATSTACRPAVRERSPSPITRFQREMSASIVGTQSTKGLALAVRSGRQGIADLDRAVGHDDTVDQQFQKRTLVLEVRDSQALLYAPAERLDMPGELGRHVVLLGVACKLLLLAIQPDQPGLDLAPPTLVFAKRDNTAQVCRREPIALLDDTGSTAPQSGTTGLQLLGQPMPTTGSLPRVCDHPRMLQDLAQVTPDKILKRARRDVSRLATLSRDKSAHQHLRAAEIIVVPRS